MIGDEVEHQLEVSLLQTRFQPGEGGVTAEIFMDPHPVMANPEPGTSSSRRSGRVSWNSRRHSGLLRETFCASGPVCQTLRSQIQSKPCACAGAASSSASGMSSSEYGGPRAAGQFRQPDAGVDLIQHMDSGEISCRLPFDRSDQMTFCLFGKFGESDNIVLRQSRAVKNFFTLSGGNSRIIHKGAPA